MPGSVPRMRIARVIHCVDAHAEGEPSRIIVGGVLDVPGTTMLDKVRWLEREATGCGGSCLFEPRGSAPLSADLVLPSSHPEADAGFIIMESSSYEGMSGTNTINTAAVLLETGMVEMVEPVTQLVLEAPAGLVRVSRGVRGRARRADHVRERPVVLHRAGRGGRGARRRHADASTSPTAAPSARSSTRPRWASRSCPTRRASSPSWASGSARTSTEQLSIAHPLEAALSLPVLRGLRRAAAGRRRRPPRDDRLPRPPRPRPHRHRDLGADRRARRPRRDGRDRTSPRA